jgi:hypothetical protein
MFRHPDKTILLCYHGKKKSRIVTMIKATHVFFNKQI